MNRIKKTINECSLQNKMIISSAIFWILVISMGLFCSFAFSQPITKEDAGTIVTWGAIGIVGCLLFGSALFALSLWQTKQWMDRVKEVERNNKGIAEALNDLRLKEINELKICKVALEERVKALEFQVHKK
jgi:hypothetical protein